MCRCGAKVSWWHLANSVRALSSFSTQTLSKSIADIKLIGRHRLNAFISRFLFSLLATKSSDCRPRSHSTIRTIPQTTRDARRFSSDGSQSSKRHRNRPSTEGEAWAWDTDLFRSRERLEGGCDGVGLELGLRLPPPKKKEESKHN